MKKSRIASAFLASLLIMGLFSGCVHNSKTDKDRSQDRKQETEQVELQVFVAASLNGVMQEIADSYHEKHPEVKLVFNVDSSGTLMMQIKEGYTCDVFFSAAETQMDALQAEGLLVDGTREAIVNNQVVLITYKGSNTAVTGLSDIEKAESIALADGSVPVGAYTRKALIALKKIEDASSYTTADIQTALGGVEISEQSNVSKVLSAVIEHSCEVGTVYLSDTYGHEDEIEIIEVIQPELTGDVIYPAAQVVNPEADDAVRAAAREFIFYLTSDAAKEIFEEYHFDTNK